MNGLALDEARFEKARDPLVEWLDRIAALSKITGKTSKGQHPLDSEPARREHARLMSWYYGELARQSGNRFEMALDADCYDGFQWDAEIAGIVRGRGQTPLVFNEVAPVIDWLIGTERRMRFDWKVLPRSEDDVESADIKTKTLKYISDVNNTAMQRSQAAADAFKAGIGWVRDGVRNDPTKEAVFNRYQDWRNVLWDSMSVQLDLEDCRYVFSWQMVDLDIAIAYWNDRKELLLKEARDADTPASEEDLWYLGANLSDSARTRVSSSEYSQPGWEHAGAEPGRGDRPQVKVFECEYRVPVQTQVFIDGPFRGQIFDGEHYAHRNALAAGATMHEGVMMRMYVAVFCESGLLAWGPAKYRHNDFSLTPIWAYRRTRDRLPYSPIRRIRDLQEDLNKRASKAQFMLNTNQIIADDDAVEDWEEAAEEVAAPDGIVRKRKGSEFTVRRDAEAAKGQIEFMSMNAQRIKNSAGITDENMGRQTNAVSGEAIKARQMQGAVVTTELFDNQRFAQQVSGRKQLSLTEQYMTQERVLRLTGQQGKIEWVKVNQPVLNGDGSVSILNDITASCADYIMSEQDYSGTLRQVMFDSLNQTAQRLPPEVALRLLRMAYEYSDLPNKDEIANEIRKIIGEPDPNAKLTPEEEQARALAQQQQAEAMEQQRQAAALTLQEQAARVREINARADELLARAHQNQDAGGADATAMQDAVAQVRQEAAQQIEALQQKLFEVTSELQRNTAAANATVAAAKLQADAEVRVAEIGQASKDQIAKLEERIKELAAGLDQVSKPDAA